MPDRFRELAQASKHANVDSDGLASALSEVRRPAVRRGDGRVFLRAGTEVSPAAPARAPNRADDFAADAGGQMPLTSAAWRRPGQSVKCPFSREPGVSSPPTLELGVAALHTWQPPARRDFDRASGNLLIDWIVRVNIVGQLRSAANASLQSEPTKPLDAKEPNVSFLFPYFP